MFGKNKEVNEPIKLEFDSDLKNVRYNDVVFMFTVRPVHEAFGDEIVNYFDTIGYKFASKKYNMSKTGIIYRLYGDKL